MPRATPTIRRFAAVVGGKAHVQLLNICHSYGKYTAKDHSACAAVDIPVAYLPDPVAAKNYFETLDLKCESHLNFTGHHVAVGAANSHLHCIDKWWLEQQATPVNLDALASAVAWHETKNCTAGVGVTHHNCFGIRRGGQFVRYATPADSYADFKQLWSKWYGGKLPTLQMARRYSGNDRPQIWLQNVLAKYEDYKIPPSNS